MKMNHHRIGQLLSAYLDGELLPREGAAVQEHLLECRRCREEYERLRTTKGLLGELPLTEPPAEFWRVVRAPEAAAAPPRGISWRVPLLLRPAWAVAAVFVILALALIPLVKGTVDRLHAAEIGVDLYVREHALQMSTEPLPDRAYLGVVTGDADLVLVGGSIHRNEGAP
jgi:anti-sigma factor RsiW